MNVFQILHDVAREHSQGAQVLQDLKGYYLSCGATVVDVCKEVVGEDGRMYSASLWSQGGTQVFGVNKLDSKVYVVVDTNVASTDPKALQGACAHTGHFRQIAQGTINGAQRFLCETEVGAKFVVMMANGTMHGFEAIEGALVPFDAEPERIDEFVRAIKLQLALHLVSLSGESHRNVRRAGYHKLLDTFEQRADGGKEAFSALFSAMRSGDFAADVAKRYLKVIQPRILELVRGYGWIKLENAGRIDWDFHGECIHVPLERPKLTRAQIEAHRKQRSLHDAARAHGGGSSSSEKKAESGKGKKGKKAA